MKERTAKAVAEAFEEMLHSNNVSVQEMFKSLTGASIPTKYRGMARIYFKSGLKQALKSLPELDKASLAESLAMMKALKNAQHKMRALLKQTIKDFPHAPGGPPKKIKLEDEKTVCAEIEALTATCTNRLAIRRVAQKRSVSERTIYRIWRKYRPKKEGAR